MKKAPLPILALVLCTAVLGWWTHGFSAFTVFSHTLREAGPLPRPFPEVTLADQDGMPFRIGQKHKYVLLNFVYLNCPDVCHKVSNRLEGIYRALERDLVPDRLELVTITFDPYNDDIDRLSAYRRHFGLDVPGWTFALPPGLDPPALDSLLRQAGIWAYRVPRTGLINHSVYLLLISPGNEVVRVFDPGRENDAAIIAGLRPWVQKGAIASLR